ncbi:MAG: hypothetical protein AAF218_09860 [Pseudomonadota bacterium]
MLLDHTIHQLDIGHVPPERADAMAQLGYMQWLGALRFNASYPAEAQRALSRARPFAPASPAIAAFCTLIEASLAGPTVLLPLRLPERSRRGGRAARRALQ